MTTKNYGSFEQMRQELKPVKQVPKKRCLNCNEEHNRYNGFCTPECKQEFKEKTSGN